jgi:ABC-type nitrate/sulfonate/bicarbonate transport system permease component
MSQSFENRVIGLISVSSVLALWWIASHFGLVNQLLLPGPTAIAATFVELTKSGDLPRHIGVSMGRVLVGFLIAICVAIPLGTFVGVSRIGRSAAMPLVELIRPIPPIAVIPMAILWLGIGEISQYSIIAYGAFFPIFLNTMTGFAAVDPVHIRAALTLGATRSQVFRYVILMSAFPNIVVGARLGMAMAFIVLVASELIAAESGLGFLIMDARNQFRSDWMFVGMISMGILGYLLNLVLLEIERRVLRWRAVTQTK